MTGEPKYDDQVFRAEIKENTSLVKVIINSITF